MWNRLFQIFLILITINLLGVNSLAATYEKDSLTVIRPTESASLTGIYNIEWILEDADQQPENMSFQIDLFKEECSDVSSVPVNLANKSTKIIRDENKFKYAWDTSKHENGKYCLRVSGVFIRNENNYYSLYDRINITLTNDQVSADAPVILSAPPVIAVPVGGDFSYQIIAKDPQDLALTYELVKSPTFLSIDSTTGLISTVGAISELGEHLIEVRAKNTNAGYAAQTFKLSIIPVDQQHSVIFITPRKGQNFTGLSKVEWEIAKPDGIASLILEYTQDNILWEKIVDLPATSNNYDWDVSKVTNGRYFVRLQIFDNVDSSFQYYSEQFSINLDEGNNSLDLALITPDEDSIINTSSPEISIEVYLAEGVSIVSEKLSVLLNDQQLLTCITLENKINCKPNEDLAEGLYKISADVTDSAGNNSKREWNFQISFSAVSPTPESNSTTIIILGRTIERTALIIGIGAICFAILILFVPWFLYYKATSRRRQFRSSATTTNEPYVSNTYVGSEPSIVVNSTPAYSEPYVPTLGDQSFTTEVSVPQVELIPGLVTDPAPQGSFNSDPNSTMAMPTAYTDEEIPSWLKDFGTEQSYSPVGEDNTASNFNSDAQVHDSYGLALNDGDEPAEER